MSNQPYATPPQQVPPGHVGAGSGGSNTTMILAIVLGVVLMMALVCGGILVALLLPAVSAARNAARLMAASNNLRMVGLGLQQYHTTYMRFPAATVTDASGNPIWGWRVAVLPFIEGQSTWDQWQQDQSWNSPANASLSMPMPGAFSTPGEESPTNDQTHIFAVRHPLSVMSGPSGVRMRDIADGVSSTILAVYLPERTTTWTAPEDITLAELQSELARASPSNQVLVLFVDGAVRRFAEPLDAATVEAMVTCAAGDVVNF